VNTHRLPRDAPLRGFAPLLTLGCLSGSTATRWSLPSSAYILNLPSGPSVLHGNAFVASRVGSQTVPVPRRRPRDCTMNKAVRSKQLPSSVADRMSPRVAHQGIGPPDQMFWRSLRPNPLEEVGLRTAPRLAAGSPSPPAQPDRFRAGDCLGGPGGFDPQLWSRWGDRGG